MASFSKKHTGLVLFAVGFILTLHSFAGCSGTPDPARDCTSDTQCDGDAVCIDGYCVSETGASSSGSSSGSGASSSGSGSSSGGMVIRGCFETCMVSADCAGAGALPVLDADNWSCDANVCRYMGCNSTQECVDSLMSANYECAVFPGTTFKACRPTCANAVDCTSGSVTPTHDVDNWACKAGICEYLGCNSTQECIDANMSNNYECATIPGSTLKGCRQKCTVPTDCTTSMVPINDADNWACNGGFCEYAGCNSDQECDATSAGLVCR